MRVLLVDDDAPTRDLLARSFARAGHLTAAVGSCEEARAALAADRFDLVVLDVMLPDGSGSQLCRSWRAQGVQTPVLLLTARGAVGDRVAGLDAGADDYLAKPFAVAEVLARARALGRRGPALRDELIRLGDVTVDFGARRMLVAGRRVLVTAQELAILEVLASRRGRVVTRDDLIESVWGTTSATAGNTLEVLVARIRRKLGAAAVLLRTSRGVGYALGDE
jgi:DNA-binding response OmpR family regulator